MWSMILLMSRLPEGHAMFAGRLPEKLRYHQSTVCWYRHWRMVPTERRTMKLRKSTSRVLPYK